MTKKSWWVFILGILIVVGIFLLLRWVDNRDNVVGMVKVNQTVYVVTEEPGQKENALEKIGSVKKKIKRHQIPEEDWTSNSLDKGTILYAVKGGDEEFPRKIYYKLDSKFYIATEAADNNKK
ncbi:hypothetical protein ACYRFS_05615 [Listeria kieliensis]|uniref:Uncharacterized protein n=1 Tax=Listeria kieliensis TaxID=1621700 RepID=A0A3D8TT64_9LIST|nr:hypothetical protein [Listeria kieliensis]RDX02065.1 hypothetical protein UR08_00540 [Listeria kieliensis]